MTCPSCGGRTYTQRESVGDEDSGQTAIVTTCEECERFEVHTSSKTDE